VKETSVSPEERDVSQVGKIGQVVAKPIIALNEIHEKASLGSTHQRRPAIKSQVDDAHVRCKSVVKVVLSFPEPPGSNVVDTSRRHSIHHHSRAVQRRLHAFAQ